MSGLIKRARGVPQPIGTVADEYIRLLLSGGWTADQLRREAREVRARGADRLADRLEYEAARMERAA